MLSAVCLAALALGACAGGSSSPSVASTTPQPIQQSVTGGQWTPPIRNYTRTPLQTPVEPAAPALVLADGSHTLASPGAGITTFPLMQTAVDTDFAGDPATTMPGAMLNLNGATGRLGLTLNNQALNVVDANTMGSTTSVYGFITTGASIPGGRFLNVGVSELDYTAYGVWMIQSTSPSGVESILGSGAWLGGYVTPPGSLPVTGVASYSGGVGGLFDEGTATVATLGGHIQIQVDFGARSVNGAMTELQLDVGNFIHGPMNDVAFSATLDPAHNQFSGTTQVTNLPGGSTAFTSNASGVVSGRFFGPNANEIGGVWTLSDASRRIIGSFGATRFP